MIRSLVRNFALRAVKWAGLPPRDPAVLQMFGMGDPDDTGLNVTQDSALSSSAWFAGIRLIGETVGSLPCQLTRKTSAGKEHAKDHPVYSLLLDNPCPLMPAATFYETLTANAISWGDGYAEIEWNKSNFPIALWPIRSDRVSPEYDANDELRYVVRNNNGRKVNIRRENMLHIPGFGWTGTGGMSVFEYARQSLAHTTAVETHGRRWFGRGARPGGILTHPGKLKSTTKKKMAETWDDKHQGLTNQERVAILDEGVTWTAMGVPNDASQFLESRQFQIVEIARWLNIPPHMLRDLSRATFSNIEHQLIEFVKLTMRPWLQRWQHELRRKLFSKTELAHNDYRPTFNVWELLTGDVLSRYRAYATALQNGFLNRDEVRDLEELNPIAGGFGQLYTVQVNLTPLEHLEDVVTAAIDAKNANKDVSESDSENGEAAIRPDDGDSAE